MGAQLTERLGAVAEDPSGQRERVRVVHEGRVGRRLRGEEALLVRRVVRLARERIVALAHLEQRLLFAEEVILGALDDVELGLSHQARGRHLPGRSTQRVSSRVNDVLAAT